MNWPFRINFPTQLTVDPPWLVWVYYSQRQARSSFVDVLMTESPLIQHLPDA